MEEGLTKLIFEKDDGRFISREDYNIVEAILPFDILRSPKSEYDEENGRMIIYDKNPEEIRKVFQEHGYKEITE